MLDLLVKKVIARDGEREIVPSSAEEMHNFIVAGIRPEFQDKNVLCVKFRQSCCEEDEDYEDSSWYINPLICRDERGQSNLFDCYSAYGPKMDSRFIPEILLLSFPDTHVVLKKYDAFSTRLLIAGETNLSDEEKYSRFLKLYRYLK